MTVIELDFERAGLAAAGGSAEAQTANRKAVHAYLAAELGFPCHYGHNLDALYDLLTENGQPLCLRLSGRAALDTLGPYGQRLLDTLGDAARANPALEVAWKEND